MAGTLTIDSRFNGPPDSGNGGYTCGRLAAFVDADAVEVTLRLPPPVGRVMQVERDGEAALLRDGDALVAEARPAELTADVPPPVELAEAQSAVADSPFLDDATHPFPTCFVCGPRRAPGDGLRIFAGPVAQRDLCATPWAAPAELAGDDGMLPAEIVWASLDCPTSVPVANDPDDEEYRPIVLARLAARVLRPVPADETYTIVSWPVAVDGRKRHAGAALYAPDGEVLAVSRALWIELKP